MTESGRIINIPPSCTHAPMWRYWVASVAFCCVVAAYAYGTGVGIGGAREMQRAQARERAAVEAMSTVRLGEAYAQQGPPQPRRADVECRPVLGGACCFNRFTDTTVGFVNEVPITCAPGAIVGPTGALHARTR